MVSVLIRMNLTTQRRDINGSLVLWACVGILLALGTLSLSTNQDIKRTVMVDLLGGVFAVWMLILVVAPVFSGGSGGIRAEHLALLPVPPRNLAAGLIGVATLSIGPAVVLLAFAALTIYGFQLGVVPGIISIAAIALQLMVVVLLARVVYGIMGQAMQTQLGMEIVAFQFGMLFAGLSVGWFAIEPIIQQTDQLLIEGWPPVISTVFRLLPSGWGLVAVDAAGDGNWGIVAGVLLGFLTLIGVLLGTWTTIFTRSMVGRTASRIGRSKRNAQPEIRFNHLSQTSIGGVIVKELKTWMRDPWRSLELRIALWMGILTGFIPLIAGFTDFLPFVGFITILMGGIVSANLYALDGSALWQTILTPGAERLDVRGRQWAWLLLFGPVSLVMTLVFTALSGESWVWPLVLALLPASLGVTAGLALLFSILFPSPGIDPQHRRNPMDASGGEIGALFAIPILSALGAAPAAYIAFRGIETQNIILQWAGIPVGIVTGVFFFWVLGRVAYKRLETNGPELLNLLLKASSSKAKTDDKDVWNELTRNQKILLGICQSLFWLPLLPQGIIPLVFKLIGSEERSWFLALHLPEPFQWPMLFVMIALGSAMLYIVIQLPRQQRQQREAKLKSASIIE